MNPRASGLLWASAERRRVTYAKEGTSNANLAIRQGLTGKWS
jgi:hypothetical protein